MKAWIVKYRYEFLLALLTLVMLAVMEARHPYYFLQDDNRTFHLPYYVHNLKALAGGELPLFNFNQYLGTPVSFLSAPFYPVNYLAMLLSRLFLGHYFGVMEFIAALHLSVAALGFYRFSRDFGLEEPSCFFGAIGWAFSPFVITLGNSWIHTLGYAAYLPWILAYSLQQVDGFNPGVAIKLLLVRLLALLLGFPQSFLYIATFDLLLTILVFGARANWRVNGRSLSGLMLLYFGNYLLLLVVSLPVLSQLFHEASLSFGRQNVLPWNEYSLFSYRITDWLHGLFVPFLDTKPHRFGELNFVSHIGYVSLFCVLLALFNLRNKRYRVEVLILSLLGLFSFLWSADIVITKVFYVVPFFNKLRYPFKLQFFTGFFLMALAAFGFNILVGWLRDKLQRMAFVLVLALMLLQASNFLFLYAFLPQRMLSNHLDTPPFDEPLKARLTEGRIVSAGPDVVMDDERVEPGNTVPTLGYNYAMLWGLHHFGGYEALLSKKNLAASMGLINNSIFNVPDNTPLDFTADVPLDYLRKWGVRWYVVNSRIPLKGIDGLEPMHSDQFRNVLYDPSARPLVYWADTLKADASEFSYRTNSVEVSTHRDSEGVLVINVLQNPFFRGYLDGREVPVVETDDGQMSVDIPAGEHSISVKYVDDSFRKGALVSFVLLLSAAVVWIAVVFTSRGKRS